MQEDENGELDPLHECDNPVHDLFQLLSHGYDDVDVRADVRADDGDVNVRADVRADDGDVNVREGVRLLSN